MGYLEGRVFFKSGVQQQQQRTQNQSDKKQFVDFYNILIIFFIVFTTLFNKSGCKEASILDFLPSTGFSVQIL